MFWQVVPFPLSTKPNCSGTANIEFPRRLAGCYGPMTFDSSTDRLNPTDETACPSLFEIRMCLPKVFSHRLSWHLATIGLTHCNPLKLQRFHHFHHFHQFHQFHHFHQPHHHHHHQQQ